MVMKPDLMRRVLGEEEAPEKPSRLKKVTPRPMVEDLKIEKTSDNPFDEVKALAMKEHGLTSEEYDEMMDAFGW